MMINIALNYFIVDKLINTMFNQMIANITPLGSRGEFDVGRKYKYISFFTSDLLKFDSKPYLRDAYSSYTVFYNVTIESYEGDFIWLTAESSSTCILFSNVDSALLYRETQQKIHNECEYVVIDNIPSNTVIIKCTNLKKAAKFNAYLSMPVELIDEMN